LEEENRHLKAKLEEMRIEFEEDEASDEQVVIALRRKHAKTEHHLHDLEKKYHHLEKDYHHLKEEMELLR